ncbi:MAG: PilZ domain-containing protein [Candidatus Aminicenantes bacterium]|nr:PilZ domain-containing protein [Candidatus Aminicenantes bacterium]
MVTKIPADNMDLLGPKKQGFTFPLPTQVEGLNAKGRDFSEETVLTFISHEGSSFCLKNPIQVGSRLKMIVDLPERLADNVPLKLVIRGRVAKIEAVSGGNSAQRVTLKFDSKYIIKPEDA